MATMGAFAHQLRGRLLPTGLEKNRDNRAPKHQGLFYAIEKGNLIYAQKDLSQNFDPNLVAENGYTAAHVTRRRAAISKMVELAAQDGSGRQHGQQEGDTAIELACASLAGVRPTSEERRAPTR